jgi:cold shock CspA family protein
LSVLVGVARLGVVAAYDAGRGLGSIAESDGHADAADRASEVPPGSVHAFHCTAIADGSRAIDPGTAVAFVLAAGLGGRLEARSVTPIGAPGES